jgi:alpha-D-glucose phosphate-specific phosphoglucomutase
MQYGGIGMNTIKFGTDGWRAIIAEDFTFENVRCVTQGIAQSLLDQNLQEKGVVVGYDTRFMAERFANVVTEVLAANGVKVYLCKKITPTPVVAYAVTLYETAGAIMLTASHNPAEYLGIKFIPGYAGPALPSDIEPITTCILNIESGSASVNSCTMIEAWETGLVESIEPQESYRRHLESILNLKKANTKKVVADPMFGAGIGYIEDILIRRQCAVWTINNYRDPLFGGSLPEPSNDNLSVLKAKVLEYRADIGIALDGDADRLAIVDRDERYYSPNDILTLLLDYLVESRGWTGKVARTVATTHMIDRLAELHGLEVIETPVGFKYIGEAMRDHDAFLGGEESGGISIRGHIPEKDGIMAACLFVEMLSQTDKSAAELLKDIQEKVGTLYSERLDMRTNDEGRKKLLEKMSKWEPETLNGQKVVSINRLDGLKIILENGSWCLVRVSGTEPAFRIYVETVSPQEKYPLQMEVKKALLH